MTQLVASEEAAGTLSCACFNVRRAARSVTRLFDQALDGTGLGATQFTLLSAVCLAGPVPVTRLADALEIDRTTLTRTLAALEKRGFIAVVEGEDRRTKVMRLTPLGEETYAAAFPLWKRTQERLIRAMGPERFQELLGDLWSLSGSASKLACDPFRERGTGSDANGRPASPEES